MFNGRFLVTTGESPKVILANGGSAARFRASISNSGHGQVEILGYGTWDASTGQVTGPVAKGPKIDAGTSAVVSWDGQVAVVVALVAGTGLSASGEWTLEFS